MSKGWRRALETVRPCVALSSINSVRGPPKEGPCGALCLFVPSFTLVRIYRTLKIVFRGNQDMDKDLHSRTIAALGEDVVRAIQSSSVSNSHLPWHCDHPAVLLVAAKLSYRCSFELDRRKIG